jgi:GTP-binding protein
VIVKSCRLHSVAQSHTDFPRDARPQVAFMGASNVGKSSLINRLLRVRGLARTSKSPGRTRAIFFYLVNDRVYFVDLPGYGYAKVPERVRREWKVLVESYLGGPRGPDLSILLVDVRREATEHDMQLADWLKAWNLPRQVVLTKADKLSRSQVMRAADRAGLQFGRPPGQCVAASAVTGDGIPALWRIIDDACAARRTPSSDPPSPSGNGVPDTRHGAAPGGQRRRARRF